MSYTPAPVRHAVPAPCRGQGKHRGERADGTLLPNENGDGNEEEVFMHTQERMSRSETQPRRTGRDRRERRSPVEMITRQRKHRTDGEQVLLSDMLKGAVAGAVGVLALDMVVSAMWDREDPRAVAREREARPGGLDPAHAMANRIAEAVGTRLTPEQPHPAGIAVHYGLGIGPGAAYGAFRKRMPVLGAAGGLAFGLALFLLQDEGLNTILGTSGTPGEYPWQAHVRGLVGHLVLGAVTDATLDVLDRVFDSTP